jgi:hypothetical protein
LIWLKVNVEGAEKEIIEEMTLLRDYQFRSILVSFDVQKIPSRIGVKKNLEFILREEVQVSFKERSSSFGVAEWLQATTHSQPIRLRELPRVVFRSKLPLFRNVRRMIITFSRADWGFTWPILSDRIRRRSRLIS